MTDPDRKVAWYPMSEERWPSRYWIGSTTWVDGSRIFARIAPGGDASLPPILMLHGLVVSGAYFRPIAHYLDDRFRLFIPDLPGVGRSPASALTSLDQLVDLLAAWMDIHALSGAVVVANSLGCQVATKLAVRHPHRVLRLVMVAPTTDPNISGLMSVIWRGLQDIPREQQSLWRIWVPDFFLTGPARALRALRFMLADPQMDRLPAVSQPVLGVAGERDPICPEPWVSQFATLVRDGRSVVIPGAPHAMNYSAPRELARIITDLVENG